jgi:hypothetical protein
MTNPDGVANLIDPDLFPADRGPPHHLFDRWRQTDPVHWNPPNPAYVGGMPGSSGVKGCGWALKAGPPQLYRTL